MRLFALVRWETVVLLVWAAMTVQASAYVVRYGQNLPRQDEWEFVSVLYGHESRWDWVWSKHYEHRYPLARMLYLALHAMSGHNFCAGMWVTVAVLSASALLLIGAARGLRGRSHPIDVFLPVLLLNAGHCENLTMGYQIAFTLTAFCVAVLLYLIALGGSRLWAGLLLLPIALGGGLGLVFVPPIGAWLVYQALRERRASQFLGPLIALTYCAFCVYESLLAPPTTQRHDLEVTLWHAAQFLTQGLGGVGRFGWPALGIVVLLVQAEVALALSLAAWRRPPERPFALGLLAVLLGVWLAALAVGHTRSAPTEFRYTTPSCLAGCVCVLVAARYWRLRFASLGLVAAAGLAAYFDWQLGKHFGEVHQLRYNALQSDIHAGVPADLLAERHTFFPGPTYHANFRLLSEHGSPALRGAAVPRPLQAIELPLPCESRIPAWNAATEKEPRRLEFALPCPRHVRAVRVYYDNSDSRYLEVFQLHWEGAKGPRTSTVFPWLIPETNSLVFWIDDTLSSFGLQVAWPSQGLKLTRVEVLVDGE